MKSVLHMGLRGQASSMKFSISFILIFLLIGFYVIESVFEIKKANFAHFFDDEECSAYGSFPREIIETMNMFKDILNLLMFGRDKSRARKINLRELPHRPPLQLAALQ